MAMDGLTFEVSLMDDKISMYILDYGDEIIINVTGPDFDNYYQRDKKGRLQIRKEAIPLRDADRVTEMVSFLIP